jgi:hypothetical protein
LSGKRVGQDREEMEKGDWEVARKRQAGSGAKAGIQEEEASGRVDIHRLRLRLAGSQVRQLLQSFL